MGENKHYKGKNFIMDWDDENKILSIIVSGYHKKEDAKEFIGKFKEIVDGFPSKPLKIMVNGLALSKSDHEARRIYTEYTKKYYKARPGIVALCSSNLFVRMVGRFVVAVAPNTKFRVFESSEDGLKWLKSLK